MSGAPTSTSDKICFVVMGFGKKTDFQTGRVLDLDKSYRSIIKPAVESAGLKSVRADEIVHSGLIDVPMYRHLLTADVVIADLSTYNCNAFYELGVRHALRPYSTITIAESKLVYPFDVNHTVIQPYEHLGTGIDFEEVMRVRQVLETAIRHVLANPQNDSPVYQFLNGLKPPVIMHERSASHGADAYLQEAPPPGPTPTVAVLMEQVEGALEREDWIGAKTLLATVRQLMKDPSGVRPEDPHIIQQLALATYKSKTPTAEAALQEALEILQVVHATDSHDPETLGLCAAIHKRLWQLKGLRPDLDAAIGYTQKGFLLRQDYYNGINLAFLLNVRASISEGAEAVTDFVLARRVRREVVEICNGLLHSGKKWDPEEKYWIMATLAEAWSGLDEQKREKAKQEAYAVAPKSWMKNSTEEQLGRLQPLLEKSPLQTFGLERAENQ
jgi:hypothetical protein